MNLLYMNRRLLSGYEIMKKCLFLFTLHQNLALLSGQRRLQNLKFKFVCILSLTYMPFILFVSPPFKVKMNTLFYQYIQSFRDILSPSR